MPYYKDKINQIHFLDSTDFEHLLPEGYITITDKEAENAISIKQEEMIASSVNPIQFISDIKAAIGGVLGSNTLAVLYPLLFPSIQTSDWVDVSVLILDAKSKEVINTIAYNLIKASAIANNIPITLK